MSFHSIRPSPEDSRPWQAGELVDCILLSFPGCICCGVKEGTRNTISFPNHVFRIELDKLDNSLPRRVDFIDYIFGIVVARTFRQYGIIGWRVKACKTSRFVLSRFDSVRYFYFSWCVECR